MEDALRRCRKHLKAGSDGIMIHSRKSDGAEILDFAIITRNLVKENL